MRDVLEAIVTHPQGIDPETLAEIRRYTKLFWINSGPYNNLTARKFVLKCTPESSPTRRGRRHRPGRAFPTRDGESLEALLERLRPMFFDPDGRPDRHQQDTGARQGHPGGERQQPLRRRHDGDLDGLQGDAIPSTRGW